MSGDIFERIAHGRTADDVVAQIESLILESVLKPGDRLPAERTLSQRLDVSRPILRDALKELERRGLIESRKGDGSFVCDVTGQIFAPALVSLIARHAKATRDYLEYRSAIESMTAELAAGRSTPADHAMLRDLIAAMRAAHEAGRSTEEAELDVEFHDAIGECAHNIVLLHTLRAGYRLLSDGVFYSRSLIYRLPGARDKLLTQHEAIAEAVISGDGERARQAAAAHIAFVVASMEEAERHGEWQRVAERRLSQRKRGGRGDDLEAEAAE